MLIISVLSHLTFLKSIKCYCTFEEYKKNKVAYFTII